MRFILVAFLLYYVAKVASYSPYGEGQKVLLDTVDKAEKQKRAACVVKMMKNYIFRRVETTSGDTVYVKTSPAAQHLQKVLLRYLHNLQKYRIIVKDSDTVVNDDDELNEEDRGGLINIYLVLIKYPLDLIQDVQNMKKLSNWNPQAIFFIIIDEDNVDEESTIGIFNQLRKDRVLNAFVLTVNDEKNEVISYTWLPFSNGSCGVKCNSLYKLDLCKDENFTTFNRMREKIPKNLNNCRIKVAAVVSEPYIMPATKVNGTRKIFEKGIEIELLRLMTKLSNTTLKFIPFGNYTSGDQLEKMGKMMDNEEVDIIAGNLFPGVFTDVQDSVEALRYNFQERITWCVPKAEPISYLLNLVFVFRYEAWIVIVLMTLMVSAMVVYFEIREGIHEKLGLLINFFVTFAMLAGAIARIVPRELSFRFVISGWLMAAIVTNVIIQSSSQSSLIQPRMQKQIKTFREVLSTLNIGGHGLHVSSFDVNVKEELEFRCKYAICAPVTPCIERVVLDRDFAILAPLRYIEYYEKFKKKKDLPKMYCLKQNVLRTYNPSLMTWKNYPFYERLETILKRIFESGLVFKWSSDVLPKYKEKEGSNFKVLGMKHLIGVFNLLFFFWGLSFLVFVMELITARAKAKDIIMDRLMSLDYVRRFRFNKLMDTKNIFSSKKNKDLPK